MSGGGAGNKPGTDEETRELEKAAILDPQEEGGFLSRDQKRTLTADPAVRVRHTTPSTQHCPRPSMVETTAAV